MTGDLAILPPDLNGKYSHKALVVQKLHLAGEVYPRYVQFADGTQKWGPGTTPPGRQTFVPKIYSGTAGTLTEIMYGTSPTKEGWYVDNGLKVSGVIQVRLGAGADMGPDGHHVIVGLPVEADGTLGNGLACRVGDVTFGIKSIYHKTDCKLHVGDGGNLGNGLFGYFVDPTTPLGIMQNTVGTQTSDGGGTANGWNDFHIVFDYFKKTVT